MITLFRRVREKLVGEGNVRRYLIYAIGEILLVVIGILIALQINNWNQTRLDRQFEMKSLSEIESALDNDIQHFDQMRFRLARLDSSIQLMKERVYNGDRFIDSLYKGPTRWYYLRTGIGYQYNRGPYDALKSVGLDKIQNDELRRSLIDYYDFSAIRRAALVQHYNESFKAETDRLDSFLGVSFIEKEGEEYNIYSKFPEDLFSNPDFTELLEDIESRAYFQTSLILNQKEEMEALKELIRNTLGHL